MDGGGAGAVGRFGGLCAPGGARAVRDLSGARVVAGLEARKWLAAAVGLTPDSAEMQYIAEQLAAMAE